MGLMRVMNEGFDDFWGDKNKYFDGGILVMTIKNLP